MQPIEIEQLTRVTGGAGGAILGSLLQNAGPIMNGVASIIGAAKSGRGGGGGEAAAPPPGASAAPAPVAGGAGGGDPLVSVAVSINGVRQA